VAETFGLLFEKRTHFSSVQGWNQHPFTTYINECCELPWSAVVKAPKEAMLIAWLGREKQIPVLGYIPYGSGYVVFIGQTLFFRRSDSSFSKNLINSMGRYSLDEVNQVPLTRVIHAEEPLGLAPRLIEPLNNSTFLQPKAGQWRFDWEDIPDVEKYEIVILGPSASVPLVQARINKPEFKIESRKAEDKTVARKESYIAGHNLRGWSWKVRAQYNNGNWGPWSKENRFNVELSTNDQMP
jgi:hypothetical protein